jgi:hypothetical protein
MPISLLLSFNAMWECGQKRGAGSPHAYNRLHGDRLRIGSRLLREVPRLYARNADTRAFPTWCGCETRSGQHAVSDDHGLNEPIRRVAEIAMPGFEDRHEK